MNGGWGISNEIALRWMPLDLTDDKSTLVQVMAWCRQATSHYLSQCWPRSMLPNGVTRPQWVNTRLMAWASNIFVRTSLPKKKVVWNVNWLWLSDAIQWHRSWLTLSKLMACWLTAPSNYLNQCWLIITGILWHSPESNFIISLQELNP